MKKKEKDSNMAEPPSHHHMMELEAWRKSDARYRSYCVVRRSSSEWEVQLQSSRGKGRTRVGQCPLANALVDTALADWAEISGKKRKGRRMTS